VIQLTHDTLELFRIVS